jgi:hypothetical protein
MMGTSETTPKNICVDIAHVLYVRDTAQVESLYRHLMPN